MLDADVVEIASPSGIDDPTRVVPMRHSNARTSVQALAGSIVAIVFLLGLFGLGRTALGAQSSCGEYSYGFPGTRLLNDGISNSAGPFAIELPSGTYDVTMRSHDAHDQHPGQLQHAEQWYFVLDSGYTSPRTPDIPDDENTVSLTVPGQRIDASTSITVRHNGTGSINSVDVVCVGFTPVPTPTTTVPSATSEPTETTQVPESIPRRASDIGESASIIRPTVREATITRVQQEPQLALTGASSASLFAAIGIAMIGLGIGLVTRERRLQSSR